MYASSCHNRGVDDMVKLVADSIQRPLFNDEELEITAATISFENDANLRKPEPEPLMIDWVHEAAFRGNTVGFSKYCKTEETSKINRSHLLSFMSQYYTPDRIVLGGKAFGKDF